MDHEDLESGFENNHLVAVCHPDLDPIDERLAAEDPEHEDSVEFRNYQASKDRTSHAADLLQRVLLLILPPRLGPKCGASIGNRLIALSWMLQTEHPDISGQPMSVIADKIGMTRAILSYYVREFETAIGIHVRGQKRSMSPKVYSASAKRAWNGRESRAIAAVTFAKKRIRLVSHELTDAIANQPREVVERLLQDWAAAALQDIDSTRLKTQHNLARRLKEIGPTERPEFDENGKGNEAQYSQPENLQSHQGEDQPSDPA